MSDSAHAPTLSLQDRPAWQRESLFVLAAIHAASGGPDLLPAALSGLHRYIVRAAGALTMALAGAAANTLYIVAVFTFVGAPSDYPRLAPILGSYALSGATAGIVVGLLNPLGRSSELGARIVGAVAGAVVFPLLTRPFSADLAWFASIAGAVIGFVWAEDFFDLRSKAQFGSWLSRQGFQDL